WVERHDATAAAAARWYLNAWEWATMRLTDAPARTTSPGQRPIDADEAAAAGLAADRLPAVIETGALAGAVTRRAADGLGLRAGGASLIAEAASLPPGADGLLFLPYLAGERSPIWDPHARGAFVGLTLGHGAPHLVRAIMEAAAFALRHVATPILEAGLRIDAL